MDVQAGKVRSAREVAVDKRRGLWIVTILSLYGTQGKVNDLVGVAEIFLLIIRAT